MMNNGAFSAAPSGADFSFAKKPTFSTWATFFRDSVASPLIHFKNTP
jgi:hypothetical protein